ncbi:hypothetical protein BGX31_001217 [Mortierella sp. GBA43]|nr:hypothetical protein BGX31_001217 [Mortierella sp. GBA43]
MNTGNGTNPATPTIEVTDSATPRIALQNTRTRKVQCRGLTPKHKNVADNTLAVLRAMQAKPPFVPFGQKRVAWEAVANLIRTIPDLVHANGSLCETRYKQVRDEYVAAQAESRRATGIAEAPPTEQDQLLEDLIGLERDFDKKEQEEKQRQVDQAAQASQHQAHAEDLASSNLSLGNKENLMNEEMALTHQTTTVSQQSDEEETETTNLSLTHLFLSFTRHSRDTYQDIESGYFIPYP